MNGKNDGMDTIFEPAALISGNTKWNEVMDASANERVVTGKQSTNYVNTIGKITWESCREKVVDALSVGMTQQHLYVPQSGL